MADMPMRPGRHRAAVAMILRGGKPGAAPASQSEAGGDDLLSAAEDLLAAVRANDAEGVASAMRAGFQILGSEPDDYEEPEE